MTPFAVNMFPIFRRFIAASILILLVAVAACTGGPTSPAPRTPTAAITPSATLQPQPVPPTPIPDTTITLTLWLPTRFLPAADNPAYQVLRQQLDEFAGTANGTPSQIIVKQDRGSGGLLDLLRTASPVAPAVLPDIVALDNTDLDV